MLFYEEDLLTCKCLNIASFRTSLMTGARDHKLKTASKDDIRLDVEYQIEE